MDDAMLYCVAVPCTEEVIDLITLLSIDIGKYELTNRVLERCGFFIYRERLEIETIDADTEWLLESKDAVQVLAYYANRDFNGICTYLNTLPERPFNVFIASIYLT